MSYDNFKDKGRKAEIFVEGKTLPAVAVLLERA